MTAAHERASRLVTERLVLRRAAAGDLEPLNAMMSDPQTMRWWSTPPHPDLHATRRWLEAMMSAPVLESDDFIVELNGETIGKLGAWRWPEIGYLIARPHWGRGYAREALAAFVTYAFGRGQPFLTADVDPRNGPSLALLTRAGFRETGRAQRTWLVGDAWCDSIYLRLDASDRSAA